MITSTQKRNATIHGLQLLGCRPILGWGGYEAFRAPGDPVRYLVGRRGALRTSTSTIRESVSITNSAKHREIIALGSPKRSDKC